MTGDRWFHRLLRLLPFDFRADYGEEMERTFRDERREAAGPTNVLRSGCGQSAQSSRLARASMRRSCGRTFAMRCVACGAMPRSWPSPS